MSEVGWGNSSCGYECEDNAEMALDVRDEESQHFCVNTFDVSRSTRHFVSLYSTCGEHVTIS